MKNQTETNEKPTLTTENCILDFNLIRIVKDYEIELKVMEKILIISAKKQKSLKYQHYYSNEGTLKEQFKKSFKNENLDITTISAKIFKSINEEKVGISEENNKLKLTLTIENDKIEISFNSLFDLFFSNYKKIQIFLIIIIILFLLLVILVGILFSKKGNKCETYKNDTSQINENLISISNDEINDLKAALQSLQLNKTDETNKLNENFIQMNNNMTQMNKQISFLENEQKKIVNKIDNFNFSLNNFQLATTNLTPINTFKKNITKLKQFPSGNIISIVNNNTILISDKNFNDIQEIVYAHNNKINYIEIFDDNNFVTCCNDSIKTWIKKNNIFEENATITINEIKQVIYNSKGNLISLSKGNEIKIWEYNQNNFRIIKNITVNNSYSILLLEDKNILVSVGEETIFFNLINYDKIKRFNFTGIIDNYNFVERISEDKVIIGKSVNASIISISQKQIIHEIFIANYSFCYKSIYNKGIFLVTQLNDLSIYRSDNFDIIQTIEKAHEGKIEDIIYLQNETIVSVTGKEVKLWNL